MTPFNSLSTPYSVSWLMPPSASRQASLSCRRVSECAPRPTEISTSLAYLSLTIWHQSGSWALLFLLLQGCISLECRSRCDLSRSQPPTGFSFCSIICRDRLPEPLFSATAAQFPFLTCYSQLRPFLSAFSSHLLVFHRLYPHSFYPHSFLLLLLHALFPTLSSVTCPSQSCFCSTMCLFWLSLVRSTAYPVHS